MLKEHSLTLRDFGRREAETSHCSQKWVDSDKRRYQSIELEPFVLLKSNIPPDYFLTPAPPTQDKKKCKYVYFDLTTKTRGNHQVGKHVLAEASLSSSSACSRYKPLLAKRNGEKSDRRRLQELTLQYIFNSRDRTNEAGQLFVPR